MPTRENIKLKTVSSKVIKARRNMSKRRIKRILNIHACFVFKTQYYRHG
jgi:hypothetical protein